MLLVLVIPTIHCFGLFYFLNLSYLTMNLFWSWDSSVDVGSRLRSGRLAISIWGKKFRYLPIMQLGPQNFLFD
jgi:hypothetical protein